MAKQRKSIKQSRPDSKKIPKVFKIAPKYKSNEKRNKTINKGGHSLNPDRIRENDRMRTKATINRLNMYKNFKAVRDKNGKITKAAPYQGWLNSGTVARVEPHRKWFGNTRVVGQEQLQKFQENLGKVLNDPYQVVMRQTKLPITLLQEKAKQQRVHVVDTESFSHTFGKKAQRKKPKLAVDSVEALSADVEEKQAAYKPETDRDLFDLYADRERAEASNPLFRAGRSNRVWGELYKVLDASDVIVQVVDTRDPEGTRCKHIEDFLRKERPHKHLITILNKVDLVPTWVTRKWMAIFAKQMPTICFHASIQHSFGKGSLINLLRQYAVLHKDKQQISVGFIGYPNVGKSSIVNTLKRKRVCKAAPVAGETRVWQYVALTRRIYLIDCPGVVYPQGDTETQTILKGVVRVEKVDDPENHVQGVLDRVKVAHLKRHYLIDDWTDYEDFISKVAIRYGKLVKGGDPDLVTASRIILNDFQRGRLPYYQCPPGCEKDAEKPEMSDQAPINVLCADEDEPAVDSISELGEEVDEAEEVDDEDGEEKETNEDGKPDVKEEKDGSDSDDDDLGLAVKQVVDDDDDLTDVASNISGLSDLSGMSDLDADIDKMQYEDVVQNESKEEEALKKGAQKKRHQKGKKWKERQRRKENTLARFASIIENSASTSGSGVALSKARVKAPNMWRKKLEKRRKSKHQV